MAIGEQHFDQIRLSPIDPNWKSPGRLTMRRPARVSGGIEVQLLDNDRIASRGKASRRTDVAASQSFFRATACCLGNRAFSRIDEFFEPICTGKLSAVRNADLSRVAMPRFMKSVKGLDDSQ
jgi:hypothetical protein